MTTSPNANNHIFIFSVGPVQAFIAQARKTQDLYGGSRLLSHLAATAITTAQEQGIAITYPYRYLTGGSTDDQNIPNQFAGTYEGAGNLATIGQAIEDAVRNRFTHLAQQALQKLQAPPHFDQQSYFAQINSHLEITWFFIPHTPATYAHDYQTAERIFGGLKNIRTFAQLPEKGRKCNLDGERNVKVYRKTKDETDTDRLLATKLFTTKEQICLWEHDDEQTRYKLLQTGEGLSAVSFLKRWFEYDKQEFPSTANIALYDFFNWCANKPQYLHHLQAIAICLGKTPNFYQSLYTIANEINGQVFYEENHTPKFFDQQGLPDGGLNCVRQQVQKLPAGRLQKYYAVLSFDGDNMGKIMTGSFLKPDKQNEYLLPFQKETSRLLTEFARKVTEIVKFPQGKVVYAGGDDCLALINLNHLYNVLLQVQGEFHRTVNSPLQQTFADVLKPGFNFTFSAGIAIAHYKTPLGITLQKAHSLQNTAKETGGRNAFAIGVLKKSGETHQTCFKWEQLPHLQTITQHLQADNFSDTFIRSLNRELELFVEMDGFINQIENANFIRLEMQRLLERSKKPDLKNADFTAMQNALHHLLDNTRTLEYFLEALNIANYIKRQTNKPLKTAAHAYQD